MFSRNPAMNMRECSRRALMRSACLVFMICAVNLVGCAFSDTITEVIYDQDESYEIDYDAPKIYLNSTDGDVKSDQIPMLEAIEKGDNDLNDLPDFDGDLSDADIQEASTAGDGRQESDDDGKGNDSKREADAGNERDDKAAGNPQARKGQGDADANARGESNKDASRDNPSDSGIEDDAHDSNSDASNTDLPGTGTTGGGTGESIEDGGGRTDGSTNAGNNGDDPNDPSNSGDNPGKAFYETGAYDDLPTDVHTVAAVGNAAIVAAALGGADGSQNLVAADEQLLSGQAAIVLSSKDISTVTIGWSGDGSAVGSADIDTLKSFAPDAVLVSDGENSLSKDEQATLEEAGVKIVFIPAITTPETAKKCVLRIGALLGKGGDTSAADLATTYEAFVDDVLGTCEDSGDTTYTLYVTEWRSGTYSGSLKSSIEEVNGAAFAPGGALVKPLNAFLKASNVQNTPSMNARYKDVNKISIVWPFAGGTKDSEWSGLSNVNGVERTSGNSGFDLSLTRYTRNATHFNMGDASYPAFICKTADVQQNIKNNRAKNMLYSSSFTDLTIRTSISSDDYDVLLNPCGLFCSWADGSMESILETAWAHKMFKSDDGYFEKKLKEFYKTFYGYELSDTAPIINASYVASLAE